MRGQGERLPDKIVPDEGAEAGRGGMRFEA